MTRPAPPHYLRRNESCWSPPFVGFFDTETTPHDAPGAEVHTLRLWCADALDRRAEAEAEGGEDRTGRGTTGAELADWIARQLTGRTGMWLFAHNLSFDLSTTLLLDLLAGRGWAVTGFGSTDRAPWFQLRRGSKRLTVCDSWSWLPEGLRQVGALAGVAKPALPDWEEGDDAWYARCAADVAATRAAVTALMDWWDAERLGRWSITGAATGWNAMRHRMGPQRILVRPTDEATAFERRAVRGGRRDTWRFGQLEDGSYLELDIALAHGATAAHLPLPVRRLDRFDSLALDSPLWASRRLGALARCRVQATRPRWPMRATGATWWPVGEFWTVLAWPEMQAARAAGDLVEVAAGYRYLLGRPLAPWADWCCRLAQGETPRAPAVAALAAKAWTRSVVGKWAGRTSEARPGGPALQPTWGVEKARTRRTGRKLRLVTVAGERWWVALDLDGDNCFPAVLAWVESYERAALGAMVTALPPAALIHCDTDGLICDLEVAIHHPEVRRRRPRLPRSPHTRAQLVCEWLTELVPPYTVRPKGLVAALTICGPQQLWLDRRKRLAGVPRSAVDTDDGRFKAKLWPKLWWQVERGRPGAYVRPEVAFRRPVNTTHRWVTAAQVPLPVLARALPDGTNQLVGWAETAPAYGVPELFRTQHPKLEGKRG